MANQLVILAENEERGKGKQNGKRESFGLLCEKVLYAVDSGLFYLKEVLFFFPFFLVLFVLFLFVGLFVNIDHGHHT